MKTFKKFENVLSTNDIFQLYQGLLDSAAGEVSIDAAFNALNKVTGRTILNLNMLVVKTLKPCLSFMVLAKYPIKSNCQQIRCWVSQS